MKRFLYKKHKFIYFIILVLIGMTLSFLSTYQFSFAIELSSTSIIDETFKEKFLSLSKSEQKIAYLTFDDGPTLKATPKILDILKEEDVVATFFVVGKHVKENPELVKRAYDEGHFIANHGYNHNNSKLYKNDDSFINEIKNIVITVVVATSVVQGSLTLSFLCLIRIEQEQPSSNICSFYKRNIDERWILYSPQRLILPIQGNVHWLAVNISDINPVTFGNAVSYRCPAI